MENSSPFHLHFFLIIPDVFLCTEAFVVCQNYTPPKGYIPNMSNPLLDHSYGNYGNWITKLCSGQNDQPAVLDASVGLVVAHSTELTAL